MIPNRHTQIHVIKKSRCQSHVPAYGTLPSMKRAITALLLLLLLLPLFALAEVEPGFEELFPGENATQWRQCGPGTLTINGGESMSASDDGVGVAWFAGREYSDFVLKVEFMGVAPEFNSGIRLRLPKLGNDPSLANQAGYEVGIHHSNKPYQWETGAIHGLKTPDIQALKPQDWNEYEISVIGQEYTVTLNGRLVNRFTGNRALSGYIGIEENSFGAVKFRNLRVKELTSAGLGLTPADADFGPITRYIWTWSAPGIETSARFQPDSTLLLRDGAKGTWKPLTPNEIEVRLAQHPAKRLRFDSSFARFWEVGAATPPLTGARERSVPELAMSEGSPGAAPAPEAGETGILHLLEDSNVSAWRLCGKLPITLRDGMISTESAEADGQSILWYSARKFGDFSLAFEYMRTGFGAEGTPHRGNNSGVFVRFNELRDDPDQADHHGYEIDINGATDTGAIVRRNRPADVPEKIGQWNTMEIQMIGSHLWVKLNGNLINDFEVGALPSGYIGVQNFHGGPGVTYRNMRIRELPSTPLPFRAPQSLEEALLSYAWTWKEAGVADHEVFFLPEGKIKRNRQVRYGWNWSATGSDKVLVKQIGRGDPSTSFQATAGFARLEGKSFSGSPVVLERGVPILPPQRILARIGKAAPGPPGAIPATGISRGATAPPAPTAKADPAGSHATFQGMALAPDWLPERLGVDQKYTEDLRYYAQRVIAGAPQGAATTPDVIWGDLKWLMPVDLAIKSFGSVSAVSSSRITNQSYPHHSLTLHGFNARIEDLGYRFNRVFLISDIKGQLVSVQFVAQAPKVTVWLPQPVEDRNPVFDLVNVKRNTSTGNQVSFQIIEAGTGVKMIKLVLRKPLARMELPPGVGQPQIQAVPLDLKWLEDSHWYLPAPLAARFIEIADKALQR